MYLLGAGSVVKKRILGQKADLEIQILTEPLKKSTRGYHLVPSLDMYFH